jgi:hypothetical protein
MKEIVVNVMKAFICVFSNALAKVSWNVCPLPTVSSHYHKMQHLSSQKISTDNTLAYSGFSDEENSF